MEISQRTTNIFIFFFATYRKLLTDDKFSPLSHHNSDESKRSFFLPFQLRKLPKEILFINDRYLKLRWRSRSKY